MRKDSYGSIIIVISGVGFKRMRPIENETTPRWLITNGASLAISDTRYAMCDRLYLNWKNAKCTVPSLSVKMNWRHVPFQAEAVFQL